MSLRISHHIIDLKLEQFGFVDIAIHIKRCPTRIDVF